jgi:hypothetical protein
LAVIKKDIMMLKTPPEMRNAFWKDHAFDIEEMSSAASIEFIGSVRNGKRKIPTKKTMEKDIDECFKNLRDRIIDC